MTPQDFKASLGKSQPPQDLSDIVAALWWQGKGDWARAHQIVQELDDPDASLLHAHLHRVEGDLGNASYWYRRADRPLSSAPLEQEWQELVKEFLAR